MNTRQCTYLLAIEECGYLSHAAQRLGLTQAALSKFLTEQERLAGVALFTRRKKRLYPTPAGREYLDAARQILEVKHRTLQTILRLGRPPAVTIRVASTPYRGAELFSRVYVRFSSAFPSVDLKLEDTFSARQEERIHLGEVDFAFGANCHARFADVHNLAVSREEIVLAVPVFHPLARYAGPDPSRLVSMPIRAFQDTPFVLPGPKNNIRLVTDRMFAQAGFSPLIAFETDNSMAVESLLHQGAGAGFLTRRYARPSENLVYFRPDPPAYEISYLRYAAGRKLSQAERCLCGLLLEERQKALGHTLIPSQEAADFLAQARGLPAARQEVFRYAP